MKSRKERERLLDKAVAAINKRMGPVDKTVKPSPRKKSYRDNTIMQDDADEEWREQYPDGLDSNGRKK